MHIETWALDRVIPYDKNPRKNDPAVDAVAKSLAAFGWRQPIVVDREGVIVVGHGDGTLTVVNASSGNFVLYGEDGKAIGRDPGQVRFAFLLDDAGTPADPYDDELLAELGMVKGPTGRNDDFCSAVVPALS